MIEQINSQREGTEKKTGNANISKRLANILPISLYYLLVYITCSFTLRWEV